MRHFNSWELLYIMYDSHLNDIKTGKGCCGVNFKYELLVYWNPLLLFISMTPPESLNVTLR